MSVYRVGTNKSSINNFPSIRPSLDLDFANTKTLDPRITFTRASSGSYFGADGILKYAGVNEARFDHDPVTGESLGLLIEEQRTNSIRNNTMVGAVAGTPGTAPTNWTGNATVAGITRQIVGTGIEDGINYIDYRIAGTTTAALFFGIVPELSTAVAATNGQTWTFSSYARLIAGSLAGFTRLNFYVAFNNSSGTAVQFVTGGIAPTSAALGTQRFTRVGTASDATTAFVQPAFQFEALSGASIDITLRIGLPQLEQGTFATSVIPTTTSSRTRVADNAQITGTNFSSWYRQDEGTFYADAINTAAPIGGAARRVFEVNNNSEAERLFAGFNSTTLAQMFSQDDNVVQVNLVQTVPAPISNVKLSAAYRLNDTAFTANGSTVVSDTVCTIPTPTQLTIGGSTSGGNSPLNSTIKRLVFWPKKLPNSQLQTLTR